MIKWLRVSLFFAGAINMAIVLADYVPPEGADDLVKTCGPLLPQTASNPPQGTTDATAINNMAMCLNNCDQLYQGYADAGDFVNMLSGISYCRTTFSNLYNQSLFLQANANLSSNVSGTNLESAPGQTEPGMIQQFLQQNAPATPTAPAQSPSAVPANTPKKQPPQINWF